MAAPEVPDPGQGGRSGRGTGVVGVILLGILSSLMATALIEHEDVSRWLEGVAAASPWMTSRPVWGGALAILWAAWGGSHLVQFGRDLGASLRFRRRVRLEAVGLELVAVVAVVGAGHGPTPRIAVWLLTVHAVLVGTASAVVLEARSAPAEVTSPGAALHHGLAEVVPRRPHQEPGSVLALVAGVVLGSVVAGSLVAALAIGVTTTITGQEVGAPSRSRPVAVMKELVPLVPALVPEADPARAVEEEADFTG